MNQLPTILQLDSIKAEVSSLVTQNASNEEGLRAWFEDRLIEADDALFDIIQGKRFSENLVNEGIQAFIGFWLEYGSFEVANKHLEQVSFPFFFFCVSLLLSSPPFQPFIRLRKSSKWQLAMISLNKRLDYI